VEARFNLIQTNEACFFILTVGKEMKVLWLFVFLFLFPSSFRAFITKEQREKGKERSHEPFIPFTFSSLFSLCFVSLSLYLRLFVMDGREAEGSTKQVKRKKKGKAQREPCELIEAKEARVSLSSFV